MLQRVAVVGAGAAGLCAARHILSRPDTFTPPVVFELSGNVGGTWCYEEQVGTYPDGRPVLSSMYRDLRTNLPKEVMMFPDFPFDPQLSSFLPHQEVQRYLESYCQRFQVRPHIQFNTAVESVTPVSTTTDGEDRKVTWEVTSSDSSGHRKTETFDAVFVCSGHYSDPHVPDIPGIQNFKGQLLHSHSYRSAEPFSGLTVLVLGAKASGLDISMELVKAGAKVTLSHRYPPLTVPLPLGIQQSSSVEAVEDDGTIRLQDGSACRADVLMFCTGYNFSYPFLDPAQLGLEVQDHLVSPLYRYMLPPAFPSLFFIGICKIICPFPNFNCQVQFALAVLDGSVRLPPQEQMEEEVWREQRLKLERGVQRHHLLKMDQDQWDYCDALAGSAGFPPLLPVVRSLYEEVWRQRQLHPENYRKLNYRLVSATCWELLT
ncbi:flavin-containing monooxygenase FMO GS-OX5 [Fundulus heteroclitus]|uniref:flavin-containing monooxygenase FMO GS-OX5 n=1 Tax=Fundulus heteroclitus TaxID=8078 RepID=UPI00165AB434|nr:flavin-containing monooxygenase FMO GS-OX5 [Fundulus heteroclitus]XP_035998541.1 flavin-containing monooxygenase FMO GS-OX5 [Fundulus heteroclitus]XP_035998542.1 flavin-containing monooxygenase FMO GS-OX5 [Fundulus heteroclitus]